MVIKAVEIPGRRQVLEGGIALLVLREKNQMVGNLLGSVGPALGPGDIRLASQNRLKARLLRPAVEVDRAEHVAVVGHCDRGHPLLADGLDQILDSDRAVEQRVERMQMQMSEGH